MEQQMDLAGALLILANMEMLDHPSAWSMVHDATKHPWTY